jgi:hypothetical protein
MPSRAPLPPTTSKELQMSRTSNDPVDDIVHPDRISKDFLYEFFNEAYFNVYRDDVGDVFIKDSYTMWVFPQQDGEQIRLMAQFKANPDVPRTVKLEYANTVNDGLKFLRAYVDVDNDIGFDYYIVVKGGITKRNIAFSVRSFSEYVRTALQRDEHNVIS